MAAKKDREPEAVAVGQQRTVPVNTIHPNPWNYNVQADATFDKLLANVREFGFVEPPICRTLADGTREIINGEHRYRAALQLGMREVPIVDLGTLSDARAKQLTITLNELGGSPDQKKLAELLADINKIQGVALEDLMRVMPYDDAAIEAMIASVDVGDLGVPNFQPGTLDEQGRLDQKSLPDGKPQTPPELKSEVLVEIRCTRATFQELEPTLREWSARGIQLDIS